MIDPREIGRQLPRTSYSEGTLQKTGKRQKKWLGYWYVHTDRGRRRRKAILGLVSEMDRRGAKESLRRKIAESRGQAPPPPENPTLSVLWDRYCSHKDQQWSKVTKDTLLSLFKSVLKGIGNTALMDVTLGPLQAILNRMAKDGRSASSIQKARTHLKAMFEFAVDERMIPANPARGKKLVMPKKGVPKPDDRFYTMAEVRALLAASQGRERIALRLLLTCGLRSQELVLLRANDVQAGRIMVDEAFKRAEAGAERIGEPKTEGSGDPVPIPKDLERELRQYIREHALSGADLIWGTSAGTPIDPSNYLDRTLRLIAEGVGIEGFTYQAARRTCATHFGHTKMAQRQLRHASPSTTRKHYEQDIPEEHRKRLEAVDAEMRKARVVPIKRRA